jgi:hypothetical protein
MSSGAELSSIHTALEGLTQRISGFADSLAGTERDDLAAALYEVERSLGTAQRRLAKIVDALV